MKLKANRQVTNKGGHGIDIQLTHMRNTPQVYWSTKHSNSYVTDGVQIFSINGIGEIRWVLEFEGSTSGDSAAAEVRAYFLEAGQ